MGAPHFRIRNNGKESEIGDMAELVRMVRLGRLGPATEIWDARTERWGRVEDIEGIDQALAGNPWLAWEQIDETDPDLVLGTPDQEEPTVPPYEAVDPEDGADEATEPPTIPSAAVDTTDWLASIGPTPLAPLTTDEPEDEEPSSDGNLLGPAGKVIAFPTEKIGTRRTPVDPSAEAWRRSRTSGAHALQERPVVLPRKTPPSTPEPPRVRLSVLLAVSVAGFVGLGWWEWYVNTTSEVLPGPSTLPTVHSTRNDPKRVAAPPPSPERAQLQTVQDELVGRLPEATRPVASESDLEMALNTEMASLGLDVIEANASVLSWTTSDPAAGAPAERIPQVVEFRVRVRPANGQLSEREQGAVALVVGRYIDAYDLVVTRFDLVVETEATLPRTIPMEAMRAQRFAAGDMDLGEYLRVP